MDVKPLTREQIATTERKLSMPLDDIIKMSKNTTTKNKKPHRVVNKSQTVFNHGAQNKALKMQHYMDSRPLVRQGALAQRRSNFQRNQFPITTEVARKAAVAPFGQKPFARNMGPNTNTTRTGTFVAQRRAVNASFARKSPQHEHQLQQKKKQQLQQLQGDEVSKQRPKTLDSLFANMKEQRMRSLSQQNHILPHNGNGRRLGVPWARARFGN